VFWTENFIGAKMNEITQISTASGRDDLPYLFTPEWVAQYGNQKSRLNTTRRQGEFNFGEPKDNGPTCTEDAPAAYHVSETNKDAAEKKRPLHLDPLFSYLSAGLNHATTYWRRGMGL